MFEIFSSLAREAIMRAQDEAIALGDDFVGAEHLLIGLAGVPAGVAGQLLVEHGLGAEQARSRLGDFRPDTPPESQIAPAEALAAIGIDVAQIRQRADETFGPGAFVYPRPAYDAAARAALEESVAQARALGDDYVGTGHMLLGMLAGDSAATRILGSAALDEATARPLVVSELGERRE